MPTPSIQTLRADAQQVLNLDSISAVRSVVAATLANANAGTPLNPNLTTQQLWNEFYQIVTQPKSDIESIIANQLMKFLFAPPAPGGAGADKQVIFNDGGVLAGDPQFLWNKTTNLLTVTGSATITGDLTVDTSTLKVDSANDRVGIGTASPAYLFDVLATGASTIANSFSVARITGASAVANDLTLVGPNTSQIRIMFSDTDANGVGEVGYDHSSNRMRFVAGGNEQYRIDPLGVFTWLDGAGGTRMTLNATGLGVGASPSFKFHVQQTLAGTASAVNPIAYIVNNGSGNTAKLTLSDAVTTDGNITLTGSATAANRLLGFGINGVQQMVLDGNGNVGIGVTPSAWVLGKVLEVGQLGNALWSPGAGDFRVMNNSFYGSGPAYKYAANGFATMYQTQNGQHQFHTAPSGTAGNAITFTQAMTLTAGGDLLVGVTAAPSGTIGGSGFIADSNSRKQLHLATTASTSQVLAVFINPNGTVGTIETNGSSTAYNISSDYRLKEEVKPLTGALNRITALKPSTYKWKVDGSSGEGFLAHELAEVVPFAVSGQKDAVNADGSMKTQGVDLSKIIPILVAAVQELTARVQTLETR